MRWKELARKSSLYFVPRSALSLSHLRCQLPPGESLTPIGYRYRTPSYRKGVFDAYFFEKNLQGDVIAVYNSSGTKLVSYTYDAWGNCTATYVSAGASTPAQYNPIRYRGYYYDAETGFYYLQSRYYDPEVGRFINADEQLNTDIFGTNLFAYCGNNPMSFYDPYGQDAILLQNTDGVLSFGHTGLLLQDANGVWYHFWWRPTGLHYFGTKKTSAKVDKVGEFLKDFNFDNLNKVLKEKEIYSGEYEKMIYYSGDYTNALRYAQSYCGRYHVLYNNCLQLSLKVLAKSNLDSYQDSSKWISKRPITNAAFNIITAIPNVTFNMIAISFHLQKPPCNWAPYHSMPQYYPLK